MTNSNLSNVFSFLKIKGQKITSCLLISFALLVFVQLVSAQTQVGNYEGYIVTNSKDTIQGSFKKEANYISPTQITFFTGSAENTYKSEDINAFYIRDLDLLFESYVVEINEDSNTADPITGDLTYNKRVGSFFLMLIAKTSTKGFYELIDDKGVTRYYYKADSAPQELLIIKQYVYVDGVKKVQTKTRYKIQLLGEFIDCKSLSKSINSLNLGVNPLSKLLKEYADCTGENLIYTPTKNRMKFSLGVNAGYSILGNGLLTTLSSPTTAKESRLKASKVEEVSSYEFGLSGKLQFSRNSKFSLVTQIKFKQTNIQSIYTRELPVPTTVSSVIYDFENTYLSSQFMIRFKAKEYNQGQIFLEGGFFLGTGINGNFSSREATYLGNDDYTYQKEKSDTQVRNSDMGFALGIGYNFGKLNAICRYSISAFDRSYKQLQPVIEVRTIGLHLEYFF